MHMEESNYVHIQIVYTCDTTYILSTIYSLNNVQTSGKVIL